MYIYYTDELIVFNIVTTLSIKIASIINTPCLSLCLLTSNTHKFIKLKLQVINLLMLYIKEEKTTN